MLIIINPDIKITKIIKGIVHADDLYKCDASVACQEENKDLIPWRQAQKSLYELYARQRAEKSIGRGYLDLKYRDLQNKT